VERPLDELRAEFGIRLSPLAQRLTDARVAV
jgi:hypothetical protein